jgi:hypothetical protein
MKATGEAFVQAGDVVAYDLKMIANKWDFELESIDCDGLVCLFSNCCNIFRSMLSPFTICSCPLFREWKLTHSL